MNNQVHDVLVLGGGPSGLTSAIYTARAGLSTVVLAGNPAGGQLMLTSEVENFPGFPSGIMGPQLIANMREQAQRFGVSLVDENALKVLGSFKETFTIESDANKTYKARTIIIATGANAKWLGLESEQGLRGKGVSACATCDGFFFKGKIVAVVGAGDAAMEDALYLTKFVQKVYVLVRGKREEMRASKIMQKRVFENPKIEVRFNREVLEVIGETNVTGLKIKNNADGTESIMEDVRGLFVAIGHKPNTEFLTGGQETMVELGKFGYAVSAVEGIFIAGDVSDWKYRQAVTAAGYGCMAAMDCEKFLAQH